jgi:hypothetical protein
METGTVTFVKDLNAKAVAFMYHGENEQAIQVLGQATRYLQQTHINVELPKNCIDPNSQGVIATERLPIAFCVGSVDANHAMNNSTNTISDLQFGHAMYETAFLLPCPTDGSVDHAEHAVAVAVILYNTALSYHRHGLETGKRRTLLDAAALYNLIVTMATARGDNCKNDNITLSSPEAAAAAPALLLGACNNLIHIHLELFDIQEMRVVRETLRDLLRQILARPAMIACLPGQTHVFFLLNMFCLEQQDFCHARAA